MHSNVYGDHLVSDIKQAWPQNTASVLIPLVSLAPLGIFKTAIPYFFLEILTFIFICFYFLIFI